MTISKKRINDTIKYWTEVAEREILKTEKENQIFWSWIDSIYNNYCGEITMLYILDFISREQEQELINKMFNLEQKQKYGKKRASNRSLFLCLRFMSFFGIFIPRS